jgi:AraC-like DNA-binding protein
MEYQEHAPQGDLTSIIECLWTLEGHATHLDSPTQPVVPDGHPELVIHFGDAFRRVESNGVRESQALMLFAGQLTAPLLLEPTGRISVLGVRLRPDAAGSLLSLPQCERANLTVEVASINPALGRALASARDAVACAADAVDLVQHSVRPALDRRRVDPRLRCVIQEIHRRRGLVSISALARDVGWTSRHLERQFLSRVGIPPKRYGRILRFQHALRTLERLHTSNRGTRTAVECGYADQAHFVRDFREFSGTSPGEHLLRKAELMGFFTGLHGPAEAGRYRCNGSVRL